MRRRAASSVKTTRGWGALGDGAWVPLDPTNQQPVSERHVKIGHGHD
jgi:hypothetical protein